MLTFLQQRAHGFDIWEEPFVQLRVPKLFTLRGDPFERADEEGFGYDAWRIERLFALVTAQAFVAQWLESFKEFPTAPEGRDLRHRSAHGPAHRWRHRQQLSNLEDV